jgi:serine protease Do
MKLKLSLFLALFLLIPCARAAETAVLVSKVRETPVVRVIRQCARAVVNVSTEQTVLLQQNPFWGAYGGAFDEMFNDPMGAFTQTLGAMKLQSLGSGVFVSNDGLLVTNAHVVGKASRIFVTTNDGKTQEATLIGTDNENDLALIQIKAQAPTPFMTFADDVLIGETVVAVGNSLGLQNSVSAGIVSGTDRTFTYPPSHVFKDLVQTDASINIGSSGGALINLEGKLVGVNFAVVEHAQGVGFAVPAGKVRRMLEEYEKVRPRLTESSSA